MKRGCKEKLADWLKSKMNLEIDQDALIDIQSLGEQAKIMGSILISASGLVKACFQPSGCCQTQQSWHPHIIAGERGRATQAKQVASSS